METVICGIQHIGVGVCDVVEAYNWYIKAFGCDVMIADADGVAERMLPYTGGKPRRRRAILAVNLQGGAGFEVWQPMDGNIHKPAAEARLGDYGTFAGRVKCADLDAAYAHFQALEGAKLLGNISLSPCGQKHFFMSDPYGNIYDIVEDGYRFVELGLPTGGVDGEMIGVSDMDRSLRFYAELVGFDKVIYDETGTFGDLAPLPGGNGRFRRVRIAPSGPSEGPLSDIYGQGSIELFQAIEPEQAPVKLYEGRWWGDPGFIQLCFDIKNMKGIRERALALGHDFVCDGGEDFKMDAADGHFTYVEDPDGTLIEFVETFKIPVLPKLGIYLNLKKRDERRKLPRFLLKALRFMRIASIK